MFVFDLELSLLYPHFHFSVFSFLMILIIIYVLIVYFENVIVVFYMLGFLCPYLRWFEISPVSSCRLY